MKEVVIVDGVRTAQGTLGGVLKDVPAHRLGTTVTQALLERSKLDPAIIDEVVFGHCIQTSDSPNTARVVALNAGIPFHVPAWTVHRNCASGAQAVADAYKCIQMGEGEIYIAGGVESMSNSPYVSRDTRFGKRLRHAELIDSLWEGLTDPVCNQIMGRTAENLAEEFDITREEQDHFAVRSHKLAFRATREGKFKDEIVPVTVPKKVAGREVPPDIITEDEGINVALTEQMLSSYPAVFKEGGSVTPGNACPISDGAAACLIMTEEKAKELGYNEPLGYIRSYGFAAVEPERMGVGPTKAAPLALERAGLKLEDMDLIELNEAFAAQVIACDRILHLNMDITNVNGGAIALGHPVGCTGARIVITLLNEMKRRGARYGLATECVGGGMGGAIVVERK
ncbi:MAG: thiolase family protein [Armatimonadota bacterium]|nr:MAG: thiolase family protein [Armatimonadota bacterium]